VAVLKEGSLNHQSATQAAHRDKSDGLMFGSVGDEIFVVGAPYGISNTLTASCECPRRPLNANASGKH